MKLTNNYIFYIVLLVFFFILLHNVIPSKSNNQLSKNSNIIYISDNRDKLNKYVLLETDKEIKLSGLSKFNIYDKSTISEHLNYKLKNIIQQLINNKFKQLQNKFSILDLHYVNEQIDQYNNYRYTIILFINYKDNYVSDKLFLDFIMFNDNKIHVNTIDNNINSYNTILDSRFDNISANNSGKYDLYNMNNGIKFISNLDDDLNVIKDLTPYYTENMKYKSPYFCNKYYKNLWDKNGKLPTEIYDECYMNNTTYGNKLFNPTNYPSYINDRDESDDKFSWLMYSDRIHSR